MERGNSMNESDEPKLSMNRRDALKGVAAVSLGLAVGAPKESAPSLRSSSPGRDLIQRENAKPGTRDWILTNTRTDPKKVIPHLTSGRSPSIEGYCSANSVRAGEKLRIMVGANPESAFKLEIYRTGYYNGDGARLVKRFDSLNDGHAARPSHR